MLAWLSTRKCDIWKPHRTWQELNNKFASTPLLFIHVRINVSERFLCEEQQSGYFTHGHLRCSVESELNRLIRKYLVSNPFVRSVTLKGTGPVRRSGSINYIRGSLWRGADFYMGRELSEGHITIRDMKTLASVDSMERLTFQNIFFHRRGCVSCGNMDEEWMFLYHQ